MQALDIQNAPLIDSFNGQRIVCSSNSLLCVQLRDASILLWNPSTKEVRQVSRAISYFHAIKSFVGFGFSPMVNDYQIVTIHDFDIKEVQVYSLSTGTWKDVEFGNLDGVGLKPHSSAYDGALDGATLCSESNGIAKNGAIFWFGFWNKGEEAESYDLIVSFDIALEVFSLIPFLPSAPKAFSNKLAVLENKFAMLSKNTFGYYEHSIIDLWVMGEESAGASGERWSWMKKYGTRPHPYFFVPWIIWKNEIVCVHPQLKDDVKQKILLFNLSTHEFKTIIILVIVFSIMWKALYCQ